MTGGLDILNVGEGDVKLVFENEDDLKKAKEIIPDLLVRGFALLVEIDGAWQRVHGYDPQSESYILHASVSQTTLKTVPEPSGEQPEASTEPVQKRGPRKLPVRSTKVTAVGRSAGG